MYDVWFFKSLVKLFKAKYYGPYKQNKKMFLKNETNFLDREVSFLKAQPVKNKKAAKNKEAAEEAVAKQVRKPFVALSERQKKRRTEEFLRDQDPALFEYAVRMKFKPVFDSWEKGLKAADKSPDDNLALLNVHPR